MLEYSPPVTERRRVHALTQLYKSGSVLFQLDFEKVSTYLVAEGLFQGDIYETEHSEGVRRKICLCPIKEYVVLTNPWDIAPMPQPERWGRLIAQGKCVGFRKSLGDTYFYSPDGYAWSGQEITFEEEHADTGLRDHKDQRVFDGDIVVFSSKVGGRQTRQAVILKHRDWGALFWDPERELMQKVPAGKTGIFRVKEIIGTIHSDPALREKGQSVMANYSPYDVATWSEVFGLVASMFAVVGLVIGVQYMLWGAIRPILSSGGVFAGAWLYFYRKRQGDEAWLTRVRLFSIAQRASGVFTLVGCAAYAALLLGGTAGLDEARAHPFGALLGVALVLVLLSFASIVLSGDIVAWTHGGYHDERSKT